jgi:glycosyltransferase involved in cell wall biosynthesis
MVERRGLAIVPALNEERTIAQVVGEIRANDADLEIAVVDDGSTDRTAEVARAAGARVLQLPFNLGIGGAVQTGFRYARENDVDFAVRVDGDGQHDPTQLGAVVEPVLRGEADIVVGSRYLSAGGDGYRSSVPRRMGTRILAWVVSKLTRQRITDPTSGFQALNRKAIALFAADYPHDYPEVEALVLLLRHRLRLQEVPIVMRPRTAGRSSIQTLSSAYYMVKVLLALLVGSFRRTAVPLEESK